VLSYLSIFISDNLFKVKKTIGLERLSEIEATNCTKTKELTDLIEAIECVDTELFEVGFTTSRISTQRDTYPEIAYFRESLIRATLSREAKTSERRSELNFVLRQLQFEQIYLLCSKFNSTDLNAQIFALSHVKSCLLKLLPNTDSETKDLGILQEAALKLLSETATFNRGLSSI
jgi:hypothetical protein